ncbi:carbohydrate ABC transporter permease [Priestia megaterium]|uniref:carbohydrate ABC transporter permease n=1 Tax=Priestia megaterium TaxID=1404 RepID=UPI0036D94AB7
MAETQLTPNKALIVPRDLKKKRHRKKNFLKNILAIIICLIHIAPIYIAIVVSTKSIGDFSSYWLPASKINLSNYLTAFVEGNMFQAFKNTVILTICSVFFTVTLGAMAAYPLARNNSKLNKYVMMFILSIMIIPPLSLLVPLYTFMVDIKAINTLWGMILLQTTFNLPVSVFLFTNFIKTIPRELDEAAIIDGCSGFSIFFRIILPLLKPVTATVIILTGVGVWNDYQFPLFFLQSEETKVITVAIASFFSENSSNTGLAAAGALIAVLPITILYLFLQKYFIRGMLDSAVK